MRRAGSKPASLQQESCQGCQGREWRWGDAQGRPGEGGLLEFPEEDQLFAAELCYAARTNKTLHAGCWPSRDRLQNLLARLGRPQQKPWKSAMLSKALSIPKGEREGAAAPAPSSSRSGVPEHSVAWSLIFSMTFPCVAVQILSAGRRRMPPHR